MRLRCRCCCRCSHWPLVTCSSHTWHTQSPVTLCNLGVGATFGESILHDLPRDSTVVTKTTCELLRVEQQDFRLIWEVSACVYHFAWSLYRIYSGLHLCRCFVRCVLFLLLFCGWFCLQTNTLTHTHKCVLYRSGDAYIKYNKHVFGRHILLSLFRLKWTDFPFHSRFEYQTQHTHYQIPAILSVLSMATHSSQQFFFAFFPPLRSF